MFECACVCKRKREKEEIYWSMHYFIPLVEGGTMERCKKGGRWRRAIGFFAKGQLFSWRHFISFQLVPEHKHCRDTWDSWRPQLVFSEVQCWGGGKETWPFRASQRKTFLSLPFLLKLWMRVVSLLRSKKPYLFCCSSEQVLCEKKQVFGGSWPWGRAIDPLLFSWLIFPWKGWAWVCRRVTRQLSSICKNSVLYGLLFSTALTMGAWIFFADRCLSHLELSWNDSQFSADIFSAVEKWHFFGNFQWSTFRKCLLIYLCQPQLPTETQIERHRKWDWFCCILMSVSSLYDHWSVRISHVIRNS